MPGGANLLLHAQLPDHERLSTLNRGGEVFPDSEQTEMIVGQARGAVVLGLADSTPRHLE